MVQKQAVRSRSKSASRKSKVEAKTGSSPIVNSRRRSVKNEEGNIEKEMDNTDSKYIRITRQKIRTSAGSSLDERKLEESFVCVNDISHEELKPINPKIVLEKEHLGKENNTFYNSWLRQIGITFYSISFIIFFPMLVIIFNKMCERGGGIRMIGCNEIKLEYFINYSFILIILIWLMFLSFLSVLPIGNSRSIPLSDGFQLRYRCNGILSLVLSVAGLLWLIYSKYLTTKVIDDHYYELIGSSITLTFLISLFVYLKSFYKKSDISTHSGNIPYCFLTGREINPRILGVDLKYFYEFRPGLISWALLNIIFCIKDWEDKEYKSINMSLLFCAVSQIVYCFDSLLFEGDVIAKSYMVRGKFGFVHCFGSQVIVPFLFTLTSRAIQINKLELDLPHLEVVAIVNFIGYVIYRSSNSQKNEFRRNPYRTHLTHLKTITTEHGQQLLAGGWWGLLRHPNYTGDIIMSICWSLYAGSSLAICWFYPLYFAIFIVSRCVDDERECAEKHGEAWTEYTRLVPHRILPFIF